MHWWLPEVPLMEEVLRALIAPSGKISAPKSDAARTPPSPSVQPSGLLDPLR